LIRSAGCSTQPNRGTPPCDVGEPRWPFVELVRNGEITGLVLDIGCGTGENALFFAEQGLELRGIDFSIRAIGKAEEKAAERGLRVQFLVQNALTLEDLHRTFTTAMDSGLFHTLSDRDRLVFARNLATVLPRMEDSSCSASATGSLPGTVRGGCRNGKSGSASVTAGPSITYSQRKSSPAAGLPDPRAGFHR